MALDVMALEVMALEVMALEVMALEVMALEVMALEVTPRRIYNRTPVRLHPPWEAPMPRTSPASEPVVSIRQLPAKTTRPTEQPRWEVVYGSDAIGWKVIGWIEKKTLRGAKNPFYFATGIHPVNGREYRLEGSTDLDERVNTVADFHLDPQTARQHLDIDPSR